MEVHQVLVAASAADAITNAALDLQDELRSLGPSEIFAEHIDPLLTGRVHPLGGYSRHTSSKGADLVVYHASIGEPSVFAFLDQRPEPLALIYHNISPSQHWVPYDLSFADLLETGRRELARLSSQAELAVAVSEFNAGELRSLGFRNVVVSPLVVDTDALRSVPPDTTMADYLSCLDGPVFLFVGQILPHKRPEWLLSAFHALVTYLEPGAHLVLVGMDRLRPYRQALDDYIAELNLRGAHMIGRVSDESLAACYRAADVFVTASEHEGFCAPLIEAMAFDVPVLARAYGAIPETMAGAGLLLDPEDSPLVAAEAMAVLAGEESVRAELVRRGRRRIRELDPGVGRRTLLGHLRSVGA
ncbi:MAG TPA: glycosyltransferase [Acidimicrobiales bacterium]|jgi:glycosyltransferase involved in cell wall biosynthesis